MTCKIQVIKNSCHLDSSIHKIIKACNSCNYKFKHSFQDCVCPMCTCSQDVETTLLSQPSLHKENPYSQDKSNKRNHLLTE